MTTLTAHMGANVAWFDNMFGAWSKIRSTIKLSDFLTANHVKHQYIHAGFIALDFASEEDRVLFLLTFG